jgi:hypothetical protein
MGRSPSRMLAEQKSRKGGVGSPAGFARGAGNPEGNIPNRLASPAVRDVNAWAPPVSETERNTPGTTPFSEGRKFNRGIRFCPKPCS